MGSNVQCKDQIFQSNEPIFPTTKVGASLHLKQKGFYYTASLGLYARAKSFLVLLVLKLLLLIGLKYIFILGKLKDIRF